MRGIKLLREENAHVNCLGVAHYDNLYSIWESIEYFTKELGCMAFVPQAYIPNNDKNDSKEKIDTFCRNYGKTRSKINKKNGSFQKINLHGVLPINYYRLKN